MNGLELMIKASYESLHPRTGRSSYQYALYWIGKYHHIYPWLICMELARVPKNVYEKGRRWLVIKWKVFINALLLSP